MLNARSIQGIVILIAGTFLAVWLGLSIATNQLETIIQVIATLVLIGCLFLGRRIWSLIPFLGSLQLTLMIPGTPTTMLVGQVLVIGFTILLILTRRIPLQLRFSELEWWLLLFILCVVQVYVRNPVGVDLFGGATVGGRPYVLFALAAVTALILCSLSVPARELKLALKLSIFGGLLNFFVGLTGWLVPSVGLWLGVANPSGASSEVEGIMEDKGRLTQLRFMVFIPITLAKWVCSYINPIKACFSIRWAPLLLLSFVLAGASGYRNVIGAVGLTYLVGLYYRGRLISVLAAALLGVLLLVLLASFNLAAPLPPNIQRSLSFLPGTWEQRYVDNTKESTNWRVEMWKEALFTDRWIHNKIFGDGLGISARELQHQANLTAAKQGGGTGMSGMDMTREYFMATGDYHSGPVSAVRTIGYVGLLVMLLMQLRLLVHAHRQIMRCRGTEWFSVALFFCIPIVWYPFFFVFIFGAFQLDSVAILLGLGMLRLLENNLPLPAYAPGRKSPYILTKQRHEAA